MKRQVGGRQETQAYQISDLKPGHKISGPAILLDKISTIVVEPKCTAYITGGNDIRIEVARESGGAKEISISQCDPIQLAIFSNR